MDRLKFFLEDSKSRITEIENRLNSIDDKIDKLEDRKSADECQEIKKYRKEAYDYASAVKRNLGNAVDTIKNIQDRFVELKDGPNCEIDLKTAEDRYHDNRKRISRDLKEAVQAQNNLDEAKAEKKRRDAWKKYAETDQKLHPQRIFEEYVDFLRGLAMRDADLDKGICRIADDLTKTWNYLVAKQSLTIPVSREPANVTLAHFVHLGFPEWTLWALPLIAHELGHVVVKAKSSPFLNKHAKTRARAKQGLQRIHWTEFMADAVATLTVGPAYAFACILLRFEPTSAYEDKPERPADSKRAKVIFKILNMNEPTANIYIEIKNLESEWNTALKQANKSFKLTQDDKQLDQFLSSLEEEKLLGELVPYKYPTADSWARTLKLKNEIFDNLNKNPDEFMVSDWDFKFTDVLNAAWLCRIDELEKTDDIDQASQAIDKIHQTARNLWRALEKHRHARARRDKWAPQARDETHPRDKIHPR